MVMRVRGRRLNKIQLGRRCIPLIDLIGMRIRPRSSPLALKCGSHVVYRPFTDMVHNLSARLPILHVLLCPVRKIKTIRDLWQRGGWGLPQTKTDGSVFLFAFFACWHGDI